jgi:hypothetical protein
VLLALVLTGCGSTVQLTGSSKVTGPDGVAAPVSSGGGALPGASPQGSLDSGSAGVISPGGSAPAGTTGSPTSAQGSTSGTSGGAGGSGSVRTPVPTTGRGWDAKNVYIGIITSKDTQQIYASLGASNVDPGNTQAQAQAVANQLNAQGGILGRQIVLRVKDLATLATAQDPTGTGQQVCTYFAQDNPVIAVWNVNTQVDQVPELRSCLAQKHIPLFTAAARAITDSQLARLAPYYYQTIMVSWDALAPVFVARLKAQGWFGGWNTLTGGPGTAAVKVGIVVDGTPEGTHTGKVLSTALAKAGYGGAIVYQYAQASDGQSASVQKFQGSGVTHVIVTDVELTAFQNAAASQQYKPRYGITSYNDPYSNLEASGLTPSGANNGAMGVGWAPNLDVSDTHDPGRTAGGKACDTMLTKGGQSFPNKRLAHLYAFSVCDALRLIAGGASAGGGFSGDAIRRGILSNGAFSPANGFTAALGATSPYVPGVARDLAWGSSCTCFTYGRGSARVASR